jgi:hypothetical protein
MINAVRWFFAVGAVMSFLQATVAFGLVQRWIMEPWIRWNERLGAQVPAVFRNRPFQRGWALLMTMVFGLLWWFTGTPAGHVWLVRGSQ